jgi:hypothetical protein
VRRVGGHIIDTDHPRSISKVKTLASLISSIAVFAL